MPAGKDIPSKSDEAVKDGLIQGVSSLNENKNGFCVNLGGDFPCSEILLAWAPYKIAVYAP